MTARPTDEKYMARCLQLAQCGGWHAAPNPMVGAVVVHDGRIIGEGFHRACGGPHAEVNAIAAVRHPELLPESTIYVSLEPCAHWGKTPPCADLIVERRIPRVVIGCQDLFAKVDGLGIKKLRDAGCLVKVGVLEQECLALNRHFFTFHAKHRPYITLKWAQSADGFIDRLRTVGDGQQAVRFSTPLSTQAVHHLRVQHQAILVGGATVRLDSPRLTSRTWPGRQPVPVYVSGREAVHEGGIQITGGTPRQWMQTLYTRGIQSVLVEGGASILQQFVDAGLYDEVLVETSPLRLGSGVAAPRLP